ncbi:glycosyltransferase [Tenacibaculum caenipelagi]|uniref:Cellulose synthase/poly-beta-1,6-N-acetylglucosamine synthase-like glycosyltransferase n=1 Tax=Tenacibaculum caenipelagi TaxID=1325435 RepID=A0A4R6TJY2_9FLAO|nr:glycosyltransferase [Tenacibaculum caenipelagi]TDQ29767.1 cellulose synthase/poly-beta-1,6-N-acetylglucosamine synthase-like glycosyltransferase [Tenacibaculum caenipelagi]
MIFTILFYTFVVVTAIQIVYYLSFSLFVFQKQENTLSNTNIPVSVIVYVKNNAKTLAEYIQNLTKQKHPNFEIVMVNNASNDTTLEIIENLQLEYPNIKVVNVKNTEAFWANKKYALTLGVKAATYEYLLFTELGSKALSKNWIDEITCYFSQEKSIVIGYQKLKRKKKSFSNLLFRFDHLSNTIQAFSYAKFGAPYKATNHNLAYTKEEFFKVNGYINHLALFMGEGDLFLKDAATNQNTIVATTPNSFVCSTKYLSFKEWFLQQKKQSILFSLYKPKHKFLLSFFKLSKFLFYVLAVCITYINWKIALPLIISYYLIQYIIVGKLATKLQERNTILLLPLLEVCLVLLQIIIFISNQISKPKHWK